MNKFDKTVWLQKYAIWRKAHQPTYKDLEQILIETIHRRMCEALFHGKFDFIMPGEITAELNQLDLDKARRPIKKGLLAKITSYFDNCVDFDESSGELFVFIPGGREEYQSYSIDRT